ncbi:hypothetical protein AcW2_007331 [Taiwanofungus camphoratus]|nr:hypothetical protein AcW2_007331 [Antrodia cinnamomea]
MDDARVPTSWQPRGVINLYSGHIAIASHGWKFAVYSHRRMIKQQTMGRHRCSRFVPPSASAARASQSFTRTYKLAPALHFATWSIELVARSVTVFPIGLVFGRIFVHESIGPLEWPYLCHS